MEATTRYYYGDHTESSLFRESERWLDVKDSVSESDASTTAFGDDDDDVFSTNSDDDQNKNTYSIPKRNDYESILTSDIAAKQGGGGFCHGMMMKIRMTHSKSSDLFDLQDDGSSETSESLEIEEEQQQQEDTDKEEEEEDTLFTTAFDCEETYQGGLNSVITKQDGSDWRDILNDLASSGTFHFEDEEEEIEFERNSENAEDKDREEEAEEEIVFQLETVDYDDNVDNEDENDEQQQEENEEEFDYDKEEKETKIQGNPECEEGDKKVDFEQREVGRDDNDDDDEEEKKQNKEAKSENVMAEQDGKVSISIESRTESLSIDKYDEDYKEHLSLLASNEKHSIETGAEKKLFSAALELELKDCDDSADNDTRVKGCIDTIITNESRNHASQLSSPTENSDSILESTGEAKNTHSLHFPNPRDFLDYFFAFTETKIKTYSAQAPREIINLAPKQEPTLATLQLACSNEVKISNEKEELEKATKAKENSLSKVTDDKSSHECPTIARLHKRIKEGLNQLPSANQHDPPTSRRCENVQQTADTAFTGQQDPPGQHVNRATNDLSIDSSERLIQSSVRSTDSLDIRENSEVLENEEAVASMVYQQVGFSAPRTKNRPHSQTKQSPSTSAPWANVGVKAKSALQTNSTEDEEDNFSIDFISYSSDGSMDKADIQFQGPETLLIQPRITDFSEYQESASYHRFYNEPQYVNNESKALYEISNPNLRSRHHPRKERVALENRGSSCRAKDIIPPQFDLLQEISSPRNARQQQRHATEAKRSRISRNEQIENIDCDSHIPISTRKYVPRHVQSHRITDFAKRKATERNIRRNRKELESPALMTNSVGDEKDLKCSETRRLGTQNGILCSKSRLIGAKQSLRGREEYRSSPSFASFPKHARAFDGKLTFKSRHQGNVALKIGNYNNASKHSIGRVKHPDFNRRGGAHRRRGWQSDSMISLPDSPIEGTENSVDKSSLPAMSHMKVEPNGLSRELAYVHRNPFEPLDKLPKKPDTSENSRYIHFGSTASQVNNNRTYIQIKKEGQDSIYDTEVENTKLSCDNYFSKRRQDRINGFKQNRAIAKIHGSIHSVGSNISSDTTIADTVTIDSDTETQNGNRTHMTSTNNPSASSVDTHNLSLEEGRNRHRTIATVASLAADETYNSPSCKSTPVYVNRRFERMKIAGRNHYRRWHQSPATKARQQGNGLFTASEASKQ